MPPSACSTSQSTQIVRSPSASKSTTPRSERPIRRWISTVRPSGRPLRDVARLALAGRRGQHPVLGRHPAAAPARHPARHALLDRGRADHARLAARDQRRAGRAAHEAGLDRDRAAARRRARPSGALASCRHLRRASVDPLDLAERQLQEARAERAEAPPRRPCTGSGSRPRRVAGLGRGRGRRARARPGARSPRPT